MVMTSPEDPFVRVVSHNYFVLAAAQIGLAPLSVVEIASQLEPSVSIEVTWQLASGS